MSFLIVNRLENEPLSKLFRRFYLKLFVNLYYACK